jgi:hypothetical protein
MEYLTRKIALSFCNITTIPVKALARQRRCSRRVKGHVVKD